jgi:3'-phosphoadenosine 5'-phosphosulfate (PAPS) 3'-phosphatase
MIDYDGFCSVSTSFCKDLKNTLDFTIFIATAQNDHPRLGTIRQPTQLVSYATIVNARQQNEQSSNDTEVPINEEMLSDDNHATYSCALWLILPK